MYDICFYMFSYVQNPFPIMFCHFKVIFKVNGSCQGQFAQNCRNLKTTQQISKTKASAYA